MGRRHASLVVGTIIAAACSSYGSTGDGAVSQPDASTDAPAGDDASGPPDAAGGDAEMGADAGIGCRGDAGCVRVVFVTKATYDGSLGGIKGADAKCQAAADSASARPRVKGRPFKAWLSATGDNVADRIVHGTDEYQLVDGMRVALNWSALTDGTLDRAISIDETGADVLPSDVWTGSTMSGTKNGNMPACADDWTINDMTVRGATGRTDGTNAYWTYFMNAGCEQPAHLYCFEE